MHFFLVCLFVFLHKNTKKRDTAFDMLNSGGFFSSADTSFRHAPNPNVR